jgi:hypothetical protein
MSPVLNLTLAACLGLSPMGGCLLVAHLADRVPGIFFGLPLLALASLVFAATHHEDPAAISVATVHWAVWLGGILGVVLAAVLLLGWFA